MNTKVPLLPSPKTSSVNARAPRLSAGNQALPHDIGERLRVARAQAVAQRKQAPQLRAAPAVVQAGSTARIGRRWSGAGGRASAPVVPLVHLVAGLDHHQRDAGREDRASETGRGRFRAAHRRPAAGGLHRPGLSRSSSSPTAPPTDEGLTRFLPSPGPASPLPSAA